MRERITVQFKFDLLLSKNKEFRGLLCVISGENSTFVMPQNAEITFEYKGKIYWYENLCLFKISNFANNLIAHKVGIC